ncbi:MAG: flagellar biosynthesis protein FlhF [Nitrosomonas sp.]|nr:flagellar biosynthesis protein FlhF [Nitrosomonas sp.]
MKVKRFLAATSREALRRVKEELGADAVILSNKTVPGGIEIMALAGDEIASLADKSRQADVSAASRQPAALYTPTPTTATPEKMRTKEIPPQEDNIPDSVPTQKVTTMTETPKPDSAPDIRINLRTPDLPGVDSVSKNIIQEIQAMRQLMEDQLASVGWGQFSQAHPDSMKVLRAMLNAGFSPLLARHLLDKLQLDAGFEQGLKKTIALLTLNVRTVGSDEMIEQGGVYTLIGPTGVGKTTTTAKLAARAVIRHGADKVALLTTDSYRIGGHEQLRIYGKLLGVPVRSIKDIDDLQLMLHELRGKHMVLIDTVGMSQRDQMLAEQIAMMSECGTAIKHLLLLNATSNGGTLDEVISAYQQHGIHGCIITKVDEAAGLGIVLDAVIRHKLKLHYVTNGQKVPEDLHAANSRYLLHRVFKPLSEDSPFTLQDTEFALTMAGHATSRPDRTHQAPIEVTHD